MDFLPFLLEILTSHRHDGVETERTSSSGRARCLRDAAVAMRTARCGASMDLSSRSLVRSAPSWSFAVSQKHRGLRFAGTRDGNAQELLYKYALYFLNEIKPICVSNANGLPKGLALYVDRGTLETCLHLIIISLCVVMAGSGHLQTFRFLKFLRNCNSSDGHSYFGTQMTEPFAVAAATHQCGLYAATH